MAVCDLEHALQYSVFLGVASPSVTELVWQMDSLKTWGGVGGVLQTTEPPTHATDGPFHFLYSLGNDLSPLGLGLRALRTLEIIVLKVVSSFSQALEPGTTKVTPA